MLMDRFPRFRREYHFREEKNMHFRAPLAGILTFALSLPLAADPLRTDARQPPVSEIQLSGSATDTLGDIIGGRGPNPHLRELAAIAIHTSTGNRDAAEILSRRLRKFGITREAVQNVIDATKLHAGSLNVPMSAHADRSVHIDGPHPGDNTALVD
jgi:hypothetical protein